MLAKLKRRLRGRSHRFFTGAARRGFLLRGNERRLAALRDKHKGERCVVIGMGPSLRPEDLERLRGETTFACNKIFLALESTDWRPTYYSVTDALVAENNREAIRSLTGVQKLYPWWITLWLGVEPDATYFHYCERFEEDREPKYLHKDPLDGVLGQGCSVVIEQAQMAYWMGFSEVCLIGVDFSFAVSAKTGEQSPSGEVLRSEGEVNHFHKDYRKPGETWTMPKMEEQRIAYRYLREVFESEGRRLINASRKTMLEDLERADFEALFPGGFVTPPQQP